MLCHSFNRVVSVTADRMSSPQVALRMLGDAAACDITENPSPKVEQLVISPFDEGIHTTYAIYLPPVTVSFITHVIMLSYMYKLLHTYK